MAESSQTAIPRNRRRISFSALSPSVVSTQVSSFSTSELAPQVAEAALKVYACAPGGGDGMVQVAELEGILKGLQISGAVTDFLKRQQVIPKTQATFSKDEFLAVVGALKEFEQEQGKEPSRPPGSEEISPSLYAKLQVRSRLEQYMGWRYGARNEGASKCRQPTVA